MTNTGGKTKNFEPLKVSGQENKEEGKKESTEKADKKEKTKELSKSQKSIRNLILAFIVGFVSFLPVWVAMHFANIDIPMPSILENKTSFPIEDWKFWSDLIVSLTFAAIVLLASNAVAEEKNKWTNGISWALICILFCWLVGYYGYFRKVEPQTRNNQTVIYDSNPFRNQTPLYSLYLDKGEKSFWINWKVGYKLDTWGNYQNYKLIYEDGSVVTVRSGEITYLPDPKKNTRIRLESLSDDQTIYVYLSRI